MQLDCSMVIHDEHHLIWLIRAIRFNQATCVITFIWYTTNDVLYASQAKKRRSGSRSPHTKRCIILCNHVATPRWLSHILMYNWCTHTRTHTQAKKRRSGSRSAKSSPKLQAALEPVAAQVAAADSVAVAVAATPDFGEQAPASCPPAADVLNVTETTENFTGVFAYLLAD